MNEAVTKAVTVALIDLNLDNILERLDKWVSKLTNRIAVLENLPAPDEDVNDSSNTGGHLPED
jgi:hypothetical protein